MRELRSGDLLDYIGTIEIAPPDTVRFDLNIVRENGAAIDDAVQPGVLSALKLKPLSRLPPKGTSFGARERGWGEGVGKVNVAGSPPSRG